MAVSYMAQRMVNRYQDKVKLWHMDIMAYQKSNPVKPLTKERLEKLKGISEDNLIKVANEMLEYGKAGYQEALVEWMLTDIRQKI